MKTSGALGWLGLATYVTFWDYHVEDTLSTAFRRSLHRPVRRWIVVFAWVLTTLHLFGGLPERYDPFARVGASRQRRRESYS